MNRNQQNVVKMMKANEVPEKYKTCDWLGLTKEHIKRLNNAINVLESLNEHTDAKYLKEIKDKLLEDIPNIEKINTEWISTKIKFPKSGEKVLTACRNKNMEDGIWLYDLCYYFSDTGWEGRTNWEDVLYWKYIDKPEQDFNIYMKGE